VDGVGNRDEVVEGGEEGEVGEGGGGGEGVVA